MMKKNFLPVIALLVILSAGCRKLDTPVESNYTPVTPVTQSDYTAALGALYTQLSDNPAGTRYAVEYWRMQELSTDEAIIPARDGNYDDGGQYRFLHKHTWSADHPNVISVWQWGFEGINICNSLLKTFSAAANTPLKVSAIAETKAMRSLFYFFMMDLYGNVPIIDSFPVNALPATVPRAQVFQFIESDLKTAIPGLATANGAATYGHATKWMAFALLEKMYLNAEYYTGTQRYTDAVAMADSILINGPYSLDANYGSVFAPNNGSQIRETILAIAYDANLTPGNQFTRYGFDPYLYPVYGLNRATSVAMSTIPDFYFNNFNHPGDARDTFWMRGKQYYFNGSPAYFPTTEKTLDNTYTGADYKVLWQVEIFDTLKLRDDPAKMDVGNDVYAQNEGIRSKKYYPDPNFNSQTEDQNNDVPIFRLADVILMKAEAILRGAPATTVNGVYQTPPVLVSKVRTRVNAGAVTTVDLPGLLQERAREFAWEGWRRNDLIRFGQFEGAWGFKTADPGETFRRIFPVPNVELSLNPKLIQNPGY
jgi:hypothetical protein